MKKITSFIVLALAALACAKQAPAPVSDVVDLRYRVNDVYDLPASNAQAFSIVVKSTKPWTIKSLHPTWCMIETEEGEAVADSLVHVGKGENTTVKIQYYDNTKLDDRTDTIVIASAHWVGKRVIVNQKGIAYLDVDAAERELDMDKAGNDISFHIKSNQNWSVATADEDSKWVTIKEGATGTNDGIVVLGGPDNSGEMRYARLNIFDRNGKKMKWQVVITQDGVQLEPVAVEVYNEDTRQNDYETREDFKSHTSELPVKSNASWTIKKKSEADTWFTLLDEGGIKNASARIQFQQNDSKEIREAFVVLTTIPSEPDAAIVTKEVKLRQAFKADPIHYTFDEEQIATWNVTVKEGKWTGTPSHVDQGMLLTSPTQIKKSKQSSPGTYTYHWSHIGANANARLWYVFSGQEICVNLHAGSTETYANGGPAGLKSISYTVDDSAHEVKTEITLGPVIKDVQYAHVALSFDGQMIGEFDTNESIMSNCTWGATMDLYLGVDTADSAILEWMEYLAPFSWE